MRERQKIFSLPDITQMQVNAKVHESQIDKIQRGMKAKIRVDAFADRELAGTVMDVAPLPDATNFFSSDIKVYTTRIRIDDPLPGLRPGMNAEVEILVDRKDNVLAVPDPGDPRIPGQGPRRGQDAHWIRAPGGGAGSHQRAVRGGHQGGHRGHGGGAEPGVAHDRRGEARASRVDGKARQQERLGRPGQRQGEAGAGAPGAEGAKASPIARLARAWRPHLASRAIPPPRARPSPRARGKGAGGGGAFMAKFKNIPEEDRARMKTASPEERAEIMKKAGFTDEELEQMRQFAWRRRRWRWWRLAAVAAAAADAGPADRQEEEIIVDFSSNNGSGGTRKPIVNLVDVRRRT